MEIPGYNIIEPMGRNTSGPVYLATQLSSGRTVVIKFLYKNLLPAASRSTALKQFLGQGTIACKISHPNIARVHEVGHTEHFLYTIADYIEGNSLEILGQGICILDQIYIVKQIAKALDYLAMNNCGHYNIKPANIILESDSSRAVLVDFGFGGAGQLDYSLLAQEKLLQTAYYAAPEQMQNTALDIRSDLYNLGAIFYTLLSDRPLYAVSSLVVGGKNSEITDIELPENKKIFQGFIDQAIAKLPDQRFQTGQEMIEALESIDDEEIIFIKSQQGITSPISEPEPEPDPELPLAESTAPKKKSNVVPLFKTQQSPPMADFLRQQDDADFYSPMDQTKSIPDYSLDTSFLQTESAPKPEDAGIEEGQRVDAQSHATDSNSSSNDVPSEPPKAKAIEEEDQSPEQPETSDDVYNALMERPWPLYEPKPVAQKSATQKPPARRLFLLCVLLVTSALFYLTKHDDMFLVAQYELLEQWISHLLRALY